MHFSLFLRGMLMALAAFAITTYIVTQSVWTTFMATLVCAVVIQVGYVTTILIMIWAPFRRRQASEEEAESEQKKASMENGKPAGGTSQASGVRRSSQL